MTDVVELPTEAVYGSVPEANEGDSVAVVTVKPDREESEEPPLVTVMV